jgi:hypothetical protein
MHQDGHGTVDSGHSVLSGYNEVVMLRRIPECHKLNACRIIPSLRGCRTLQEARATLYKLPHDDGRVSGFLLVGDANISFVELTAFDYLGQMETLEWPSTETISEWQRMK